LWLCLVAAASQSTQTKLALGDRIKQEVVRRIFLDNEPTINIDLLLGLLIFLAWGHNQLLNSNPAQLARFTQLATTLVFDLRLNKPPSEESNMLPISQCAFTPKGQPRSLEEKRAVLGCFVLSSMYVLNLLFKVQSINLLVFPYTLDTLTRCNGRLIWMTASAI
jgi:hypothetical protein